IEKIVEGMQQECKKGAKVYFEDGEFIYEYREEQYHFSYKQLKEYSARQLIAFAEEAIRERRLERITDRYAKNDYEKVLQLPLNKIFVEYSDSIAAHNC